MSAKDVVCGMSVEIAETTPHAEYRGAEYRFCSTACRQQFLAHPRRYTRKPNPLTRFVRWLARENDANFGNTPPKCH